MKDWNSQMVRLTSMFRRIPIDTIPTDTEGCSRWLYKLYEEKDKVFDYFARHDTFDGKGLPRTVIPRNKQDLFIVLGWFTVIGIPSIIYFVKFLLTSSLVSQLILIVFLCIGKWWWRIFLIVFLFLFSNRHRSGDDFCDRNRQRFSLWWKE